VADLTNGAEVTASSTLNSSPEDAFKGPTYRWHSQNGMPQSIVYGFKTKRTICSLSFLGRLDSGGYKFVDKDCPRSWKLEGSDDGANWVNLLNVPAEVTCEQNVRITRAIPIPKPFRMYKFETSKVDGRYLGTKYEKHYVTIRDVRMFESRATGDGCCVKDNCEDYRGKKETTRSGRTCQAWTSQSPHIPRGDIITLTSDPKEGLENNYCRNPTPEENENAWCYTTDKDQRWEACDIPVCSECCASSDCSDYRGRIAKTVTGRDCQPWDSEEPHDIQPSIKSRMDLGELSMLTENFCRNPNEHSTAWCYTMDEDKRWEDCGIPSCPETLNKGVNSCWVPCGNKGGKCDWCGDGSCCMKGWNDGGGCDGHNGCSGFHCCSDPCVEGTPCGKRFSFEVNKTNDWEEARKHCQNLGGDLASILSLDDQKEAEKYLRRFQKAWVGFKKNTGNTQHWLSGDIIPMDSELKFDSVNWRTYGGCMLINGHRGFDLAGCQQKNFFKISFFCSFGNC